MDAGSKRMSIVELLTWFPSHPAPTMVVGRPPPVLRTEYNLHRWIHHLRTNQPTSQDTHSITRIPDRGLWVSLRLLLCAVGESAIGVSFAQFWEPPVYYTTARQLAFYLPPSPLYCPPLPDEVICSSTTKWAWGSWVLTRWTGLISLCDICILICVYYTGAE